MTQRIALWLLISMYGVLGYSQTHRIDVEPLKKFESDERHSYNPMETFLEKKVNVWKLKNVKDIDWDILKEEKVKYETFIKERTQLSYSGDALYFDNVSDYSGIQNQIDINLVEDKSTFWRCFFASMDKNGKVAQTFRKDDRIAFRGNQGVVSEVSESVVIKRINGKDVSCHFIDVLKQSVLDKSAGAVPQKGDVISLVSDIGGNMKSDKDYNYLLFFPCLEYKTHSSDKNQLLDSEKGVSDIVPIWVGDTLQFRMPAEQPSVFGLPPMIGNVNSGKINHLFGVLHIGFDSKGIEKVGKVVFQVDSTQAIAGLFKVVLNRERSLTAQLPENELSVDLHSSTDVFVPIPKGNYKDIVMLMYDNSNKLFCSESFKNVEINAGEVTEFLNIKISDQDGDQDGRCIVPSLGTFSVNDNYIDWPSFNIEKLGLPLFDINNIKWGSGPFYDKYGAMIVLDDPSPVTSQMTFNNTTKIKRAWLGAYNYLPKRSVGVNTYHKGLYELKGKTSVNFDYVEIYPGINLYSGGAIVGNLCRNSKYVSTRDRALILYLKTKTCCFDYKEFARWDSLCGEIPKWNREKWGVPLTRFEYKLIPTRVISDYEQENKGFILLDINRNISKDKHFKGEIKMEWFSMATEGGMSVIRPGIVEYRAATGYDLIDEFVFVPSKESITDDWQRFTTDIIDLKKTYKKGNNGSCTFTGFFKEEEIKLLCDDINFSCTYFDGFERGVIVLDIKEYGDLIYPTRNFRSHMYKSQDRSGKSFKTVVNNLRTDKTYKVWSYLLINNKLFLSDGKYLFRNTIFGRLSQLYKPYIKNFVEPAEEYVKAGKKWLENGGGNLNADFVEKGKKLGDEFKKVATQFNFKMDDPTLKNRIISHSIEPDLPYEVVSPVTELGVLVPPYMFDELNGSQPQNFYFSHSYNIMKQFPLVFTAFIKFDIKLKRKVPNDLLTIFAYVPGNGPDGLHLGYVWPIGDSPNNGLFPIIPVKNRKIGEPFSVGAFVFGWGTPELLDQMRTIVFSNSDYTRKYQKFTLKQGARYILENHKIDWMDGWYAKAKEEFFNREKEQLKKGESSEKDKVNQYVEGNDLEEETH